MSFKRYDKERILFFRQSVFKIAELIFNFPHRTFHIRMLEKETGFSTTAIINAVEDLSKFDVILIEKTALTNNIKANLESDAYHFYKLIFNLYRLKRYGYIDALVKVFDNPDTITIFGSFAKGEDVEESDIDILVVNSGKRMFEANRKELEGLTGLFERELKRKINLVVLPSLKDSLPEFKNSVANGIVVHGYLKVI